MSIFRNMKFVISISFLLALTSVLCAAQQPQSGTSKSLELVDKKTFRDSISILQKRIAKQDTVLKVLSVENKKLEEKYDLLAKSVDDTRLRETLKSADLTIEKQNSWMTGFGTMYTIFGVIAIVLPFAIYFLEIRPAHRVLQKAKNEFKNHIDSFKIEQIDRAIENLRSSNVPIITDSTNFILSHFPSTAFNENQLYKIYTILRFENILTLTKVNLSYILASHNYPFVREYFQIVVAKRASFALTEDLNLKNYAFNYLVKFHKDKSYLLGDLDTLISSFDNRTEALIEVLNWCQTDNTPLIPQIAGFKPLVDKFSHAELISLGQRINARADLLKNTNASYLETRINDANSKEG